MATLFRLDCLKMLVEIFSYLIHQMNPPSPCYIMFRAWVREIVQLHVLLDALLDEAQAVLPYHGVVN